MAGHLDADESNASPTVRRWIAELEDAGWFVAQAMLDADALEELRAAFPAATPGSTLHIDVDDDTPHVDRWRALHTDPAIAELFAATLGPFDLRIHGRDPGRGAGSQGLHADSAPGRTQRFDSLTLIWLLDEFTVENGATRIVPWSHRGAAAVPRQLAQPDVTHPDEIVVIGEPGDVLIFDAHLWHSGRRNDVGTRRRIVQMNATRSRRL